MPEWVTALICVAIVIVAILITSLVKLIMKKVAKNNGGELDCKKWEYLFAAISLLISAAGVFCFLRFYVKITDIDTLCKITVSYAGSVQTVYLFIVQLIRKGWKGVVGGISKMISKLKSSKNPVQELPDIITEKTQSTPEESTEEENDDVSRLKNEFMKIITGKK